MNYKKNTLFILLITFLFLFSIALFNFEMDTAGVFRASKKYENGIAKIMLEGKNVANLSDYDERLVQKYYIENINTSIKTTVLGSSRSLLIAPSYNNENFFNNSVSGASLEDMIAIYEMYKAKNIKPKTIIIGLDPWILNGNNGQTRWMSIGREYNEGLQNLNISNHNFISNFINLNEVKKYQELVSMPTFLSSWKKFKKDLKNSNSNKENCIDYYATTKDFSTVFIKRNNGTISYPPAYRNASIDEINQKAKVYSNDPNIYSLGNFNKLSNIQLFETFIKYLLNQKVKIVFFLPAYHPYTYKVIENNPKYRMVMASETYFTEFAKQNHIPILGSYNPKKTHLQEKDFYDGMHLREESIKKMNIIPNNRSY